MISSALVTSIVMQSGDDNMEYGAWTTSFLGFTVCFREFLEKDLG